MSKPTSYQIRRDGVTLLNSPIPLCGYSPKKLRQIVAAGHKYYVDGKYQRKIE